jgi:4-amino-4-deoxy-L-arabinose transferase-like glycosyltransferase
LLFALCPLELRYSRITYLDNLVTPWLLACVYFALDRRRHLLSLAPAGLTFAVAVLTKETTALAAPGVVPAIWYATDSRTSGKALVVAGATASLVVPYPVLQFLLTGSSQIFSLRGLADALPGRI